MNILALNPGSGTLLYKLLNMPEAAGPNDGIVLKAGTFDHVHGNEIAAAAEQAVADCLSLGIDAISRHPERVGRVADRFTPLPEGQPQAGADGRGERIGQLGRSLGENYVSRLQNQTRCNADEGGPQN
jgi:hypothetical protein